MTALHRNLNWLVILFAVICISIGFIELLVELQRRESRVRRLIDANLVGIFIWGPSGRLVEANEAFFRLTGYSRDDLFSKRLGWTELTPAEARSMATFEEASKEGVAFVLDLTDQKKAERRPSLSSGERADAEAHFSAA